MTYSAVFARHWGRFLEGVMHVPSNSIKYKECKYKRCKEIRTGYGHGSGLGIKKNNNNVRRRGSSYSVTGIVILSREKITTEVILSRYTGPAKGFHPFVRQRGFTPLSGKGVLPLCQIRVLS